MNIGCIKLPEAMSVVSVIMQGNQYFKWWYPSVRKIGRRIVPFQSALIIIHKQINTGFYGASE